MVKQFLTIKSLKEHIYSYGFEIEGCKISSNALRWLEKEKSRLNNLMKYENELYNSDYKLIGGIDEVGRGPLAGPVVAGCVILPKQSLIPDIDDSKKLSEAKRELLSEIIKKKAISYGIGIIDNERIDRINILNSTYEAMKMAISNLNIKADFLLVDAISIPDIDIAQMSIVKGDAKSISIAAASIIAKVTRDNLMKKYDEIYPQYGFYKNKGYGTKEHIEAIKKYGPCPIHRKTFLKNILGD
ncbi:MULTISPECIES: ribonuclease HII [Thermoanaerobacterium]|nr:MULTISPECIES: ribonuclease HII [Thermoanaerobacterium]